MLHETWILDGWERAPGDPDFVFAEKLARYYDLEDPGVFYDDPAPDGKTARRAIDYGAMWEGPFNNMHSARIVIEAEIAPYFQQTEEQSGMSEIQPSPYIGMWVTADNHVRQELRPDGRYAEARGNRENAYIGRYETEGNRIEYRDDSGFTADGEFIDGILHHGGMIMHRQENNQ